MKDKIAKILVRVFLVLFLFGCSAKVYNTVSPTILDKSKPYAILPFENYTQHPLAGFTAASILEGILISKGYSLLPKLWDEKNLSFLEENKDINLLKEKAIKSGAYYIVMGSVNEFRYKTGIDGEPAVSLTIRIYEVKTDKLVFVTSVSGTGWANESLGTVTQKLLNKVF